MDKSKIANLEFVAVMLLLFITFVVYLKVTLPYINTLDTTYTKDMLIVIGLLLLHIFVPTVPCIVVRFLETSNEKK